MVVAGLVVGAVLLLAMIVQSWRAAGSLPPTARVPVHWGFGYNNFVSKRAGLITWPAAGAFLYLLLGGVVAMAMSRGHSPAWLPTALIVVIMGSLVAFQAGAIAAARRQSGE